MCPYGGSTFERESSSFQTNFCSSDSQFEKYPYTGIWKQQQSPFPQYLATMDFYVCIKHLACTWSAGADTSVGMILVLSYLPEKAYNDGIVCLMLTVI